MDARELRIGNFVNQTKEWGESIEPKVIQWDDSTWYRIGDCLAFFEDYEPIRLTEEWILKFGFDGRKDFKWKSIVGIQLSDGKYYLSLKDLSNVLFHSVVQIKFVHQLQNLYFALTGDELTIKK